MIKEACISIVVPYFCRPHYLYRLINSVHNYLDMPFELLIHDDGSTDNSQQEISGELGRMSTLILDTGPPLGLSVSVNRLVKLSCSNYILMMDADCELTRPCFNELVSILKHPYIGIVAYGCVETKRPFCILPGIGAGCVMAFRREVWEEVGGWNEEMHTAMADVSFMVRVVKKGYFIATTPCPSPFNNMSIKEQSNLDTTVGTKNKGCDNSYPKIFGMGSYFDDINKDRAQAVTNAACEHCQEPEHEANLQYWHTVMEELVGDYEAKGKDFHWDKDKYGHSKWKDLIEEEYV